MLQNWRTNVDLQVIVDMTACARYMAKYVSKREPHSKAMDAIYADCVKVRFNQQSHVSISQSNDRGSR